MLAGPTGAGFEEFYRCYSVAMAGRLELEEGGKSACGGAAGAGRRARAVWLQRRAAPTAGGGTRVSGAPMDSGGCCSTRSHVVTPPRAALSRPASPTRSPDAAVGAHAAE
jgi:hypothetical protein